MFDNFFCIFMNSFIFTSVFFAYMKPVSAEEFLPSQSNYQTHKNSLLQYAWIIHSQHGEEGVVEEIIRRLKIESGFFVEFGAFNGVALSNTRFLINRNWKGAFIEADPQFFEKCADAYKNIDRVICIKEFVNHVSTDTGLRTFDQIADEYFPEQEIDYLSIDVDSIDYLIFENLQRRPKIICVEGSLFWHPLLQERIPDEVATITYVGQTAFALRHIGEKKGYSLICIIGGNYFFIRNDFLSLFQDVPTDLLTLWQDAYYDFGLRYPDDQKWERELRQREPYSSFVRQYENKCSPAVLGP